MPLGLFKGFYYYLCGEFDRYQLLTDDGKITSIFSRVCICLINKKLPGRDSPLAGEIEISFE
tara:strand:+ start:195 stop:380 length:186 start_codon:yes stop_codon:yes gene_type:complete